MIACYVEENEVKLNVEHLPMYQEVCRSLKNEEGRICFLDAHGDTGKTLLIDLLLSKVRGQQNLSIAEASSLLAATLLPNGGTAHASFNLPSDLSKTDQAPCIINRASNKAQMLKKAKRMVWDECTMAMLGLESLDKTPQHIKQTGTTMDGAFVLVSGDFRQA